MKVVMVVVKELFRRNVGWEVSSCLGYDEGRSSLERGLNDGERQARSLYIK